MTTNPISPSDAYYIKLGKAGRYEQTCIEEDQTLRLGYREISHELCLGGQWEAVLEELMAVRGSVGAAKRDLKQIRRFYEADESVLWVTFYADRLYWCFSKPDITLLPDNTKTRPVIGEWRCREIEDEPLDKRRLSGKLLSMQGFRGTICSVKEFEYLKQKVNGRVPENVRQAKAALSDLEDKIEALVHDLYWRDFELLVDLVFRQAGWQRVSDLGKTLRTLDLELVSPITAERCGVQVKSEADRAQFEECLDKFIDMQGYTRLYFIVHSPSPDLRDTEPPEDVELWFPEDIARWVVKYGLAEWVLDKTS